MAALLGPTAGGKSEVGLLVAEAAGAEIISVDSMQVYRGMDIGTAKPTPEQQARVRHHLIDIADPELPFSVATFQREGRRVLEELPRRGTPVLLVGGSGLHFRALVDPLEFPPHDPELRVEIESLAPGEAVAELLAADPQAGTVVDLANSRRVGRALEVYRLTGATPSDRAVSRTAAAVRGYEPRLSLAAVGCDPGPALAGRVKARLDDMLARGLLEEVRRLEPHLGPTAAQAVGYRQLIPVVRGQMGVEEGRQRAEGATLSLAGRQRTFFRRDPRVRWLEWDDDPRRRAAAVARELQEAGWTS